jgi:hypothetical protein
LINHAGGRPTSLSLAWAAFQAEYRFVYPFSLSFSDGNNIRTKLAAVCFMAARSRSEATHMSTGDAVLGLAGLYLLWQQNQIFRDQNEIFATQAGVSRMPSDRAVRRSLRRYWPMLVMVPLVVLMWAPIAYDYYGRYSHGFPENAQESRSQESPLAPWLLLAGVLFIVGHAAYVWLTGRPKPEDCTFIERTAAEYENKRKADVAEVTAKMEGIQNALDAERSLNSDLKKQLAEAVEPRPQISKLTIHSAHYGTGAPAKTADVTEVVRKMYRDALVLQVNNETLECTGKKDPAIPDPKHLTVEYSHGNQIRRTESGSAPASNSKSLLTSHSIHWALFPKGRRSFRQSDLPVARLSRNSGKAAGHARERLPGTGAHFYLLTEV